MQPNRAVIKDVPDGSYIKIPSGNHKILSFGLRRQIDIHEKKKLKFLRSFLPQTEITSVVF